MTQNTNCVYILYHESTDSLYDIIKREIIIILSQNAVITWCRYNIIVERIRVPNANNIGRAIAIIFVTIKTIINLWYNDNNY